MVEAVEVLLVLVLVSALVLAAWDDVARLWRRLSGGDDA